MRRKVHTPAKPPQIRAIQEKSGAKDHKNPYMPLMRSKIGTAANDRFGISGSRMCTPHMRLRLGRWAGSWR